MKLNQTGSNMMIDKIPYWQSKKCSLSKRGIPPTFPRLTAEQINQIVLMYETGKYTYKQIAVHFNKQKSSIARLLNKKGYKAKRQTDLQRKYSINENYFDVIDSEDKAYFLGLLYADGYNNVSNYEVTLCLSLCDKPILKLFLKYLQSNHPIKTVVITQNGVVRKYCKVAIGNKNISLSLEKNGCGQAKTFKIEYPSFLESNFNSHFFRGYFDGDGSFGINKKISSNMVLNITSNHIFLKQVQQILIKNTGLNATKILKVTHSDKIGVMSYGGRGNCTAIRDWMYNDAHIYLQRKFEKLKSI